MRQMHILYYQTIIWHLIVSGFLKICTDLHEIYSIWAQNCFCYCFWTILGVQLAKLFRNNNKNNFVLICCKISCKSVQIFRNTGTISCQMMAQLKANQRMKVVENYVWFPVVHENLLMLRFEIPAPQFFSEVNRQFQNKELSKLTQTWPQ